MAVRPGTLPFRPDQPGRVDLWPVEALGAYRHHSAFRAVYNKIKAGQAPA